MKKVSIVAVILWMSVIFYFSNQPAIVSTSQSDKVIQALDKVSEDNNILGNILEKLYELKGANFIIRKAAHMISYLILAVLSFIMVYCNIVNISLSIKYGFLISLLYAIFDEIHQVFIPGRAGMIQDVLIDSVGIVIGLSIIFIIFRILKNNKKIGF
ncbi:MAG: VanZ family protein [Romboutsia sp.]